MPRPHGFSGEYKPVFPLVIITATTEPIERPTRRHHALAARWKLKVLHDRLAFGVDCEQISVHKLLFALRFHA